MKVSKKDWDNYISKLSKINKTAARRVSEWVEKNGLDDAYDLCNYAYAICTKYGEASAELACEMYDALAIAGGANVPSAVPAETMTYNETAKAIQGALKQSPSGQKIESTIQRLVKQPSADTMLKNAKRDKAQFAWIPSGDTCAFCLTLASRGWQYQSRAAIENGHAEHIHANCDCNYCIRFNKNTTVEGYDPDELYEKYMSYNGKPNEKINAMRREAYEKNKDRINEQKRKMYAISKGKVGANANSGKKVVFNEKNDYSIKINGLDEKINNILSTAAKNVAELGTKDGNEHLYLVDLSGETNPYYETSGMPDSVGFDFWGYANSNKEKTFAFIHNHNTDSSLSLTDLETPILCDNIPIQIAVRNDGVIYIAERKKMAPDDYLPDVYFENELRELNKKSRDGKITPAERMKERENILIDSIIKEFYGGIKIIDGRKQ